jgi:Bacterial pullanase-associated domain/IPT/TIG domain
MARKIFAPILATLMVAGLSTGLASPAKAADTKQVVFHYQFAGKNTFEDTKGLELYLWSGANGDFYPNGNDSYGKTFTFSVAAGSNALGGLFKFGSDWDHKDNGGNADRSIALNASGSTELWFLGNTTASYSSLADAVTAGAVADAYTSTGTDPNYDCDANNVCTPHVDVVYPATQHVVIHYQDPAATKFSSYKNWDVFVYSNGSNHPNGNYFNGSDSFGKVLDLTFTDMSKNASIGVIVRKTNWSDRAGWKDGTGDKGADGKGGNRVLPLSVSSGENEYWIVRGADNDAYYTSRAAAEAAANPAASAAPWPSGSADPGYGTDGLPVAGYPANQTFTIHYNRADGNYGDWNIWMWGTGTALDTAHDFTGTDAYGVYTTLEVPGANDSLVSGFGYLLRSTHDWKTASKNTSDNDGNQKAVDNVSIPDGGKTDGLTEIWVKQGDSTSYTSNPFPVPAAPVASPASAGYGQAVTVSGTGFDGANNVTLVQTAVPAVPAVPAVTASKAPGSNVYKCGSVTKSSSTSVCVAAVPAKSAIPAATATAVAHVVSSTKVVIAFPSPAAALTGKLVVTNPAGSATSVGNFSLTKTKATATISSSTDKGLVGDTITVTGNNIGAATAVKLGTIDIANFTVTDTNSLTFKVPAGASDSKVAVTTAGGTATASKNFALIPSITSVDKSIVAIGGKLTITGVNLGAVSAVKLGEKSVTSFTKGATTVSFNVPSGSATGTVTLTAPGGEVTSVASVTVLPQPTVTNVTGTVVGSGATAKFKKGTTLTVTGTNFTGATSVKVGATSITGFSVVNDTTITFTAPTNKTGAVIVTTPGGSASSASISTTSS